MSVFYIDPDSTGAPSVNVLIQPYEKDNTIQLTPANFPGLEVDVFKTLGQPSSFSIILPPNSPDVTNSLGVNPVPVGTVNSVTFPDSTQDLASAITPMSTVIIQMMRGTYTYTVFFGIVLSIREVEQRTEERVTRLIEISGVDMQYYLMNFAYFTLTWLGAANNIFNNLGNIAGITLLQSGDVYGPPETLGLTFLQKVTYPYLINTALPINNNRYTFNDLVEPRFGSFDSGSINLLFPFIPAFYASEGTWWDKFQTFFPSPYYEMFFQTAETSGGATTTNAPPIISDLGYPALQAIATPSQTLTFNNREFKNFFVVREMPFPRLSTSSTGAPYAYTMNINAWNSLVEYGFSNGVTPFLTSEMEFSADEARTFYMIDPSTIDQLFGSATNAYAAFITLKTASMLDPIPFTKYGYIPEFSQIQWFFSNVKNSTTALQQFGASLLLTLGAYYMPLPLSARGSIVLPLSPTILQGNKITCQPFKNGEDWTFYINEVTHHFEFGGKSTTTLKISRGLPKNVYNDTGGILTAMLQGLVERANFQYQLIANPTVQGKTGIQFVTPGNVNYVFQGILPGLATPQSS